MSPAVRQNVIKAIKLSVALIINRDPDITMPELCDRLTKLSKILNMGLGILKLERLKNKNILVDADWNNERFTVEVEYAKVSLY